jgi:hypothetical protein
MPSLRLPFGGTLDRDAGVAVSQPSSMRALTNALPKRGKAEVRGGMVLTTTLPAVAGSCTAVVLIHPLVSQQEAIAVGFYQQDRSLRVFRLSGDGVSVIQSLGVWVNLHAQSEPRVSVAEGFSVVLLAHDEPVLSRRAPTKIFRVFGDGTLGNLEAEFDEAGRTAVYFRSVMAWGDYMVGFGFGSALEDRPEFLRLSLPGEPGRFDRDHYFIVGNRGEPITGLGEAGGNLMVFKASKTYRVVGNSPVNFGILPAYALVGCPHQNLIVSVDGSCYFWSLEGPRVTMGGDNRDVAMLLDLEGEDPDWLPAKAALKDGVALYHLKTRVVEWVFGMRGYALSLDGEGLKWGHSDRGVPIASSGVLYSGGPKLEGLAAPTSFSTIGTVEALSTRAILPLAHTGAVSETMGELWLRAGQGVWSRARDFIVQGSSQQETLTGLTAMTNYAVAVRHRRGGEFPSAYAVEDPGLWPSASRAAFTTLLVPPLLVSATWMRVNSSSIVRLVWEPTDSLVSHQALRNGNPILTLPAGVTTVDAPVSSANATDTWAVRAVLGAFFSTPSNTIDTFSGVAAPIGPTYVPDPGGTCGGVDTVPYALTWETGASGATTEVFYRQGNNATATLWQTAPAGVEAVTLCVPQSDVGSVELGEPTGDDPLSGRVTLRHRMGADVSAFVTAYEGLIS